ELLVVAIQIAGDTDGGAALDVGFVFERNPAARDFEVGALRLRFEVATLPRRNRRTEIDESAGRGRRPPRHIAGFGRLDLRVQAGSRRGEARLEARGLPLRLEAAVR